MVGRKQIDGAVGRGLHYGKLATSLTGSYVGYHVQNLLFGCDGESDRKKRLQQNALSSIRQELEQLGGPAIKLGQLLSLQGIHFPQEALEELTAFQMRAPAMHPTLARIQFRNAMGQYPEDAFAEFSGKPFAAASLGQVHKAVTRNGEKVAVKIQYPAIKQAIANDFKLLRGTVKSSPLRTYLPRRFVDELEKGITAEVDYITEADNLNRFRKLLAPLSFVSIPEPFRKYSADRVLTMTLMPGDHLDAWLRANPEQKLRDRLGTRLFELFYFQVLQTRYVHADPHPGNYLFNDKAGISVIDFGCVKHLDAEVTEFYRVFASSSRCAEAEDRRRLIALLWNDQPPKKKREVERMIDIALEFNRSILPEAESKQDVVDFGDAALMNSVASGLKEVFQTGLVRPQLLFAKRAELGLLNILHRLQAKVNTRQVIERIS